MEFITESLNTYLASIRKERNINHNSFFTILETTDTNKSFKASKTKKVELFLYKDGLPIKVVEYKHNYNISHPLIEHDIKVGFLNEVFKYLKSEDFDKII